jgi:hypothetical protein
MIEVIGMSSVDSRKNIIEIISIKLWNSKILGVFFVCLFVCLFVLLLWNNLKDELPKECQKF